MHLDEFEELTAHIIIGACLCVFVEIFLVIIDWYFAAGAMFFFTSGIAFFPMVRWYREFLKF